MLALQRHYGQSVFIGDDIVVRVVRRSANGGVVLGISAPPEFAIDREEIRMKKLRQKSQQSPTPKEASNGEAKEEE